MEVKIWSQSGDDRIRQLGAKRREEFRRRRAAELYHEVDLRPGGSEIPLLGVGRREVEMDVRPLGGERESALECRHGFETTSLAT